MKGPAMNYPYFPPPDVDDIELSRAVAAYLDERYPITEALCRIGGEESDRSTGGGETGH